MAGPLSGLTIVELAGIGPGPMCSMMLGDMGADVIKVEPPEGDPTRHMGARGGRDSAGFAALNRGKELRRAMGIIKARKPVDEAKLRDESVDLKTLGA